MNNLINLRFDMLNAINLNSGKLNNTIKCNNAIYVNEVLKPVVRATLKRL